MDVCVDQVQGIEPWIDLSARHAVYSIIGLVLLEQISSQFADILPGYEETYVSLCPDLDSNQGPTD